MPWSDRLGMFVRSPEEGVQEGQYAGNIFAHAADQGAAQYQQSLINKRQAVGIQQRALGMARLGDLVAEYTDMGVPEADAYKQAFKEVSPMLFYDHPEQLAAIQHQAILEEQGKEKLREQVKHWDALETISKERAKKETLSPEMRRAQEKADLELRLKPRPVTETDPGGELSATVDPMERDKMILGNLQKEQAFKDAQEQRRANAETRKENILNAATQMEIRNIGTRINTLQKAHDSLAPEQGAVKDHPNTIKRMRLSAEIAGLKEQARVLAGGLKSTPEPASEPATPSLGAPMRLGTVIKQGDKQYRYQGGDVNDPSSYVEVK